MRAFLAGFLAVLCSIASARAALAQPADEGFDKAPDDSLAGKKQTDAEKKSGDRMPGEKTEIPGAARPEESDKYDPAEEPGKAYRFIGLRFRNVIVPKFMVNIFADGGATVNAFTFGPEFTTRKDHLEFNIALSYADY